MADIELVEHDDETDFHFRSKKALAWLDTNPAPGMWHAGDKVLCVKREQAIDLVDELTAASLRLVILDLDDE